MAEIALKGDTAMDGDHVTTREAVEPVQASNPEKRRGGGANKAERRRDRGGRKKEGRTDCLNGREWASVCARRRRLSSLAGVRGGTWNVVLCGGPVVRRKACGDGQRRSRRDLRRRRGGRSKRHERKEAERSVGGVEVKKETEAQSCFDRICRYSFDCSARFEHVIIALQLKETKLELRDQTRNIAEM
ncbi:hypothetical protein Scep_020075 [Stephania cephalantha]|uniref:Uncharacterized protein n=1 Tax=Stephania cephalantha TaxID=152367 RepID=A0AAP0NQH2_9MAGN